MYIHRTSVYFINGQVALASNREHDLMAPGKKLGKASHVAFPIISSVPTGTLSSYTYYKTSRDGSCLCLPEPRQRFLIE